MSPYQKLSLSRISSKGKQKNKEMSIPRNSRESSSNLTAANHKRNSLVVKIEIIHETQYERMPWKNGLGETMEIDIRPKGNKWFDVQEKILLEIPFCGVSRCPFFNLYLDAAKLKTHATIV